MRAWRATAAAMTATPPAAAPRRPGAGSLWTRLSELQNIQPMVIVVLALSYVAVSAGMISFNKYLMHKDRFPFAVVLVVLHMAFCSAFTILLYFLRPSMFPSLTDPQKKVTIDAGIICKGALPIAVLFSTQLVLSNTAYLHSSVAFLQMMKEANLVFVYALSLFAVLERFSWRNFWILCGVILATALTIHGEVRFSWKGFAIQATSQFFESVKIVLQAMLLTAGGRKLDAFTYVLLVAPLCLIMLCFAWGMLVYVSPSNTFATPAWDDFSVWWKVLFANSFLAFTLNVVIALFVKNSSAIAFILAGILKDALIVAAGTLMFHEIVTIIQAIGFTAQLLLILVWSLIKIHPEKFEHGIFAGLYLSLVSTEDLKDGRCWGHLAPEEAPTPGRSPEKNYGTASEA